MPCSPDPPFCPLGLPSRPLKVLTLSLETSARTPSSSLSGHALAKPPLPLSPDSTFADGPPPALSHQPVLSVHLFTGQTFSVLAGMFRRPMSQPWGYTVNTTNRALAFVHIYPGQEDCREPNTYTAATGLECLLSVGNVASATKGWHFSS